MAPTDSAAGPADPLHPIVSDGFTADAVLAALRAAGVDWTDVTVLNSTGSTNSDLAARAVAGTASPGAVVAAAEQTRGRGRMGRQWVSAAGTTISFSVLLDPPARVAGFVPALAGIAVARALSGLAGSVGAAGPGVLVGSGGSAGSRTEVVLKWPNDVMVGGGKVAGILAEAVPGGVVVGCGINVSVAAEDLPVPTATSLALAGVEAGRGDVLAACLVELHRCFERWRAAAFDVAGSGLLDDYRNLCATIGQRVEVHLPDGSTLTGTARAVDAGARLIVEGPLGESALTAGDVVHLRH